ncbi:MAG TPA: hypothetical protein VMU51_01465 [Mycobacteriales bacterium]|nr:hypothetical protein [Mycobacteriales bacterium]
MGTAATIGLPAADALVPDHEQSLALAHRQHRAGPGERDRAAVAHVADRGLAPRPSSGDRLGRAPAAVNVGGPKLA